MRRVSRKRNGRESFVIQFALNRTRRALFLDAKYSRAFAEEVKLIVERTAAALAVGSDVDRRTRAWLEAIEPDLRERFERAGLIEPETRRTLGEIFDAYFRAEDAKLEPNTLRNKLNSTRRFFESFDRAADAAEFSKSDVYRLIDRLDAESSEATRAGIIRDVSRVFNWAVESGELEKNRDVAEDGPRYRARRVSSLPLVACSPAQLRLISLYRTFSSSVQRTR